MNENELVNELEKWYQNNKDNPTRWVRTKVGIKIKEIVSKADNWKGAAKWHPTKKEIEINKLKHSKQIPCKPKSEKRLRQINKLKEIGGPINNKLINNSNNNAIQENIPWENDTNNW